MRIDKAQQETTRTRRWNPSTFVVGCPMNYIRIETKTPLRNRSSQPTFAVLVLAVAFMTSACTKQPPPSAPSSPTSLSSSNTVVTPQGREAIARAMTGEWESLAPELRPSKNADGTLKSFYMSRHFVYQPGDRFELTVSNYADPYGKVVIAKIEIAGHTKWRGDHPIAAGAQKVDFTADEGYAVTPLVQGFADLLNKLAIPGYAKWEVGQQQSIFGRSFPPFGLVEGRNFMEYDLVYVAHDLLFWGARNVDGRGFDTEENRPTNLQIPMARSHTN